MKQALGKGSCLIEGQGKSWLDGSAKSCSLLDRQFKNSCICLLSISFFLWLDELFTVCCVLWNSS